MVCAVKSVLLCFLFCFHQQIPSVDAFRRMITHFLGLSFNPSFHILRNFQEPGGSEHTGNCPITMLHCNTKQDGVIQSDVEDFNDSPGDTTIGNNATQRKLVKIQKRQQSPTERMWYKRKQQQLTPNQKRVHNRLWPKFGVNLKYGNTYDPLQFFVDHDERLNRSSFNYTETVLDIGFGSGDSIVYAASKNDETRHIGVEIHRAGISTVLQKIEDFGHENIRIVRADAQMLLEYFIDDCLDGVSVFFPDPWPNSRQDGDRRIIRSNILSLLAMKVKADGYLRIATDVAEYVHHVEAVVKEHNAAVGCLTTSISSNTSESRYWKIITSYDHIPGENIPGYRPITKYEIKAGLEGRRVWELELKLLSVL